MLDPKEQAKGGFRAQLERARERDLLERAQRDADGLPGVQQPADPGRAAGATRPGAPSAGRSPKRWH